MCGRYYLDFGAIPPSLLKGYPMADGAFEAAEHACRSDICPGDRAPALIKVGRDIVLDVMRWGFERPDGGLVINARVETVGQKPMFRGLVEGQRCVLPATHYYEWRDGDGQKFSIAPKGSDTFYLAGLYRFGPSCREFVVLTQAPVSQLDDLHDRMPLILDSRQAMERWMSGETPLFTGYDALRIDAEGDEQLRMSF